MIRSIPFLPHGFRLLAFFVACSAIGFSAPAQEANDDYEWTIAKKFPPIDQISFRFEGQKPGAAAALEPDLQDTKFVDGFEYLPGNQGVAVQGSKDGGFGVVGTPIVGLGEYSYEITVGFLGLTGISINQTIAGVEVDRLNSNPLEFWFLGVFWTGTSLRAFVDDGGGSIGQVDLGPTTFAVLRVVQEASAISFYARALKATTWLLVATTPFVPWPDPFRLFFGSAFLGKGAYVLFDNFRAWGSLFDPAVIAYLSAIFGFFEDLDLIWCAMVIENNFSNALSRLLLLAGAIAALEQAIDNDGRQDLFLPFVVWPAAVKFLSSAYKETSKLEKSLDRGDLFKALPSFFSIYYNLALANLALRGLILKKAEELWYFEKFRPRAITVSELGSAPPLADVVTPALAAHGLHRR